MLCRYDLSLLAQLSATTVLLPDAFPLVAKSLSPIVIVIASVGV